MVRDIISERWPNSYHPGTTGGFTRTAPKSGTGNFFNQPPEPVPGTILNVAADAFNNVTERLGTAKQRRMANNFDPASAGTGRMKPRRAPDFGK
jgi:hypothetical protein